MRPPSYETYAAGHKQVAQLLRASVQTGDARLREGMLRGAVVILSGQLEAFLNSLGRLLAEAVSEEWTNMLPAQRRIVARYAARHMSDLPAVVPEDGFPDDGGAERVHELILTTRDWMENPGEFARSGPDLRVERLYHLEMAPAAIARFLTFYWPDGPGFFDWAADRGEDRGALWVTLTQLVRVRNDIAHGLGQVPPPTVEDVRQYLARTTRVVRLAIAYCDAGRAAAGAPAA